MSDTPEDFKPHEPHCPYCEHTPLHFSHNMMVLGTGAVVSIIWCLRCGHTLEIHYVGHQEPKVIQPQLVRPV